MARISELGLALVIVAVGWRASFAKRPALFDPATTPPVATASAVAPTPVPPLAVLQSAQVADARINESSGLCASIYAPYLWTHNDSGDIARAFLISPSGEVIAEVRLKGAQNRDWEDIGRWKDWVYCADIGDNARKCPSVVIYRFRESSVSGIVSAKKKQPTHLPASVEVPCESLTLTYPDGPHDAEALLVRHDGSLIIVTKDVAGSTIYETPQPFKNGAAMTLHPIGHLVFGDLKNSSLLEHWRDTLATSGDISPDGKRVTLITYTQLYEWTLPTGKNAWSKVWTTTPHIYQLPKLNQTEAVCYAPDGKSWWISSEGSPMELRSLSG